MVIKLKNVDEKIIETLDKIKPFLNQDGGDVKFVKFEDGICYINLTGACHGCMFADMTISNTIEDILTAEVPEVIKVVEDDNEA